MSGIVLDAEGLSAITFGTPSEQMLAIMADGWRMGRSLVVPALVCAEICRDRPRARAVEAMLSRHHRSGTTPIELRATTFDLARRVGALLGRAARGSESIVDAHVVTVAADLGGAIVFTSDPEDIADLAAHVPGARIVVRRP